jgi:Ca-activated chloride channel family protein
VFLSISTSLFAGSGEAADKVREGMANFRHGDFKAAAEAFSAADDALPNELKIAFDRGCAYAAGGEYDKAVEQFQKAAAASDHKLAGLANYNLGGVAVARAKTKLGDKPEEAEGDARAAALESLIQAARHYRDALSMDGENSDARYNLETLRLWIKHIQDVWQKRDRQKRRDAMNLLQYLEWLESEQRSLMQADKELGGAKPSPRQREAIRAAENAQRTLAEEIQLLKDKIAATLSAPPQQPGANQAASPGADVQKAIEVLGSLADEVRGSMSKAADLIAGGSLPEAAKSQSQAVETIDQIYMAVAPYASLVQRGIKRQEELINQSPGTEKQEKSDEQNASAKQAQPQQSRARFDGNEAAWNQRFIARYGRILSAKARRELEQLDATPGVNQAPPAQSATSSTPAANAAPVPEKDQSGSDEQLKAEQQRRDLKEALQLGVQSAPKVEKLADEAASLLEEDKPDEALPKQQEALKLLKDMLPKQQQQEQEKKEQDKKDQEKKDQDKKDQNKKDQEKKDQQQKEQEKKDQGKQDQNKQDKQKKDEAKNQRQQDKQQQNKRDLSKQQAEAVLHKARERQEQHHELEKTLEGYLYRPEKVEKDW